MPLAGVERGAVRVAAVDLGGTSGRVVEAVVGPTTLAVRTRHRFANEPRRIDGLLCWDVSRLYAGVLRGLARVAASGVPASVGVDSWSGDYGRVRGGRLVGPVVHHRDPRTLPVVAELADVVPGDLLFAETGLSVNPMMAMYQLIADSRRGALPQGTRALLLPDLIAFFLGGRQVTERTNASTTGLATLLGDAWDDGRLAAVGLDPGVLAPLCSPGERVGVVERGAAAGAALTLTASHDTASALAAVPARDDAHAYVSCGTWVLTGVEVDSPVLSSAALAAGFTNERTADGRARFLRIAPGLMLVNAALRESGADADEVISRAADVPSGGPRFDAGDPLLLPAGRVVPRLRALLRGHGEAWPDDPARAVRVIVDSLAHMIARDVRRSAELSGREVRVVHLVGGGAAWPLLAQAIADATGMPVEAGPVEATAVGNALVQAQALGVIEAGQSARRRLVRNALDRRTYLPSA